MGLSINGVTNLGGRGLSAKRRHYSIRLFHEMGVKNIKKWVMPFMDGHILISFYSQYMKKHHLHVSRTQIDSVKETSLNNLIPFSPFHLFGNGSHSFFQLVTSYLGSLRNRKKIHCAQKLIKSVLIQFVVSLKMAQNSTFFLFLLAERYEEKMLQKC